LNKRLTMPISGLAILLFAFFAWGVMQHATWISDIDRTGIAWIRGDFTPGKTAFLTGITLLAQPATGVTLTALFVVWQLSPNAFVWGRLWASVWLRGLV